MNPWYTCQVGPISERLDVLGGIGMVGELEEVADFLREHLADLNGGCEEELLAVVCHVDRPIGEVLVELRFQRHSVL